MRCLAPQDIEFTVQEGKLLMLQCRSGKRAGAAAVRIAVELVDEGVIDEDTAVMMVEPTHLDQLLHPQFADAEAYLKDVVGKGESNGSSTAAGSTGPTSPVVPILLAIAVHLSPPLAERTKAVAERSQDCDDCTEHVQNM